MLGAVNQNSNKQTRPFSSGNFSESALNFLVDVGEKRHRSLRECHRTNTLTGSGGSCCRATLLGAPIFSACVVIVWIRPFNPIASEGDRGVEGVARARARSSCLINASSILRLNLDEMVLIGRDCTQRLGCRPSRNYRSLIFPRRPPPQASDPL